MDDQTVTYEPIGVIETPFDSPVDMPIQPPGATEVTGTVELAPAYAAGLQDLDGFSHCLLVYHFHAMDGDEQTLTPEPFLDDTTHGVFATRAPCRPNPIGYSVVAIEGRDETQLTVSGIDVVDDTPLLDIKPFVPAFDVPAETTTGWLEETSAAVTDQQADDRFL